MRCRKPVRTFPSASRIRRAIGSTVQGFDGTLIASDTYYDANGRVTKTDRPYFQGTGTPVYNRFVYDDLGRVVQAIQPDGGYVKTTYLGLTVSSYQHVIRIDGSVINEVGTTVKNDLGQPSSVTDAMGGQTQYSYDALGEMLTVTDPLGRTVTTNVYDLRGRKTDSTDLDMGHWSYVYDSLGRLVSQTDAKHQTATLAYDQMGRMVSRTEADMVSTWTYGTLANQATYPNAIDKLVMESCTGTACGQGGSSGSFSRTYSYDTLGRQKQLDLNFGSGHYYTTTAYDPHSGKLTDTRAFSGFLLHYAYNMYGYQQEIDDGSLLSIVYWKPTTRDAELHLTQQTTYNGVVTNQSFDPLSGRLSQVYAGTNNAIANLSFDFDTAGNLAQRGDLNSSWQSESSCYDKLNRLTSAAFGNSCTGTGATTVSYDAAGNITAKSDVGTYSYGTAAGPHALTGVTTCTGCTVNGQTNPTFAYDANGSMTSGANRTATYTAAGMTATVSSGGSSGTTMALSYDPEHARSQQVTTSGTNVTTTLYFNDPASNTMTERVYPATGSTIWKTYILADGHIVAQRTVQGSATRMRYFILDHLGSVSVITDETGAVITGGRQSYDAWGKQRDGITGARPRISWIDCLTPKDCLSFTRFKTVARNRQSDVLARLLNKVRKNWSENSLACGVVLALHLAVIWALTSGIVLSRSGSPAPELQVLLLNGPKASPQANPPPPEPELQSANATPPDIAAPEIVIDTGAPASAPDLPMAADILPPRADPAHLNPNPPLPAGHDPGVVTLSVLVATDGSVSDARVAQSSGQSLLDQLALAFAKAKWRFRAAMQRGRPVPDWTTVLVRFSGANHPG